MVRSLVTGVATAAAVYGASRAFVPSSVVTISSTGAPAFRGAAASAEGSNLHTHAAALGAVAGAACVAVARGNNLKKVARKVTSGGISPWGPVGKVQETGDEFAGGLVGSEYAGLGGKYEFDPLELSKRFPENLAWFREAELKHGRVAMLAFAGLLAPDVFRIPFAPFTDPELNFINAHNKLIANFGPMWILLAACGVIELIRFRSLGVGMKDLTLENAGDFKAGALFELPKDPEQKLFYQMAELKNGRLAMLAVSGIFTAGVLKNELHFPFYTPQIYIPFVN